MQSKKINIAVGAAKMLPAVLVGFILAVIAWKAVLVPLFFHFDEIDWGFTFQASILFGIPGTLAFASLAAPLALAMEGLDDLRSATGR